MEKPSQATESNHSPALPKPPLPHVPRCHIHTDFKLSHPGNRASVQSNQFLQEKAGRNSAKGFAEVPAGDIHSLSLTLKQVTLSQEESRLFRQDLPFPATGWPGLISRLSCVDTQGDLLRALPSAEVRLAHLEFHKLPLPPFLQVGVLCLITSSGPGLLGSAGSWLSERCCQLCAAPLCGAIQLAILTASHKSHLLTYFSSPNICKVEEVESKLLFFASEVSL